MTATGAPEPLPDPMQTLDDIRQRLRALGALPLHEDRVLRQWAKAQPIVSDSPRWFTDFFPLALRDALPGIAAALVISGGAVEKHVASIFGKLGLPPSEGDNRRVLAVLRYLGG